MAVAQVDVPNGIPTAEVLAASGDRVRSTMSEAAAAGARLVQFPESTLTYPSKKLISRSAPVIDESDWTRVDWPALRLELQAIGQAARELALWTVVGAPHRLSDGARPHNSLYVFSDDGSLVTRYDKRRLSMTEITYMYAPGTEPVSFEVDGFRFGMALCLETLFADLFTDYADAGADAVLISSAGGGVFDQLAFAHAVMNGLTVTLSIPPSEDDPSTSGICGPQGWLAQSPDGSTGLVVADIPPRDPAPTFHFRARHGLYDSALNAHDPRTSARTEL